MRTKYYLVLVLGVLAALTLTLAACGGDASDSSGDATVSDATISKYAPLTEAPDGAKQGGDLKVLAAGDVDFIDPGAAYYQFSYMIDSATQRQLVAWAPGDVDQPSPDIAEDDPVVSDDGKTISFKLQSGIKFSPPVNRDVVCDDFKYGIERSLMPSVANGYVGTYLKDVTGFADAQKALDTDAKKAPDISGITCSDDTTLEIQLDNTSSAGVIGALSLPIGAPVPKEYAAPFDAETPSTYGTNQVATGPYMIENDSSGKLTGYTSGKEIKLVRNPNWDANTDDRPAYLDTIDVQEGFSDTISASKKILDSTGQVNGDFSVPNEALKQASTLGPQLTLTPSGGDRYISLNTQKPPFDDINVRKAVIASSNRTDLRNTRGGELVGPVMTHFIPPNFPGFEEAGGLKGFTDLDYLQNPDGDMALAADYMKKAGFASGKCEGAGCEIDMVGDDSPPGSDTAEVFRDQLTQLGFTVNFQKVAHDVMYTKFCNVPKNEPQVCPNVGWIKDFQDPQAFLQVPFSGDAITPSNNSNWPLLDVPAINKAIDKAVLIVNPGDRAQAWADIDHMIAEQAPAVPWVWDNQANIQSKDVAGVINLFNANWDLSYTSLK